MTVESPKNKTDAQTSVLNLIEKYKNRGQEISHLIFWFFIAFCVFILSLYLIRPFCLICTKGISVQSLNDTGIYLKKALSSPLWFLSDYRIWFKRLYREGGVVALVPFTPIFLSIFTYLIGGLVRLAIKESRIKSV